MALILAVVARGACVNYRRSQNPELTILWLSNPAAALEQVIKAIDACDGDMTAAAKMLKIGRQTLHRWVQKHASLRMSVERIREEADDVNERIV